MSKRAVEAGISEAEVEKAMEADGGKMALIQLMKMEYLQRDQELLEPEPEPEPLHQGEEETAGTAERTEMELALATQLAKAESALIAEAQRCGLDDRALPAGTRLHVASHGDGSYEHWEKRVVGCNAHFVRFDSGGVVRVDLKQLDLASWRVLSVPR